MRRLIWRSGGAAAPQVWARQTTGAVASAAINVGINVPYPASISPGDLLVLCVGCTPPTITFTLSDLGFTARASRNTNATVFIYTKIATGSESGNINITTGAGSSNTLYGVCRRYTGGSESVITSATAAQGSVANLAYPALTIGTAGALVVGVGIKLINGTAANIPSPPFSNQIGFGHTSSPSCFIVEDDIQTTATNVIAGTWTITGDAVATGIAVLLALAHA